MNTGSIEIQNNNNNNISLNVPHSSFSSPRYHRGKKNSVNVPINRVKALSTLKQELCHTKTIIL